MLPRPDTRWPPWCACCQAAAADVSPWSRVCLFLVCLTFSSGTITRPTHLPRHYPLPLLRLVMTFLDSWTGNHTMGIAGILVLADIGLAAGAKLEVHFSDKTIGLRGSLLPGPVAYSDLDVCLWILDLYLHNSPPSSNLNWLDFHGGTGEKSHWIRSKLLHIHSESHHQHQQYQVCQNRDSYFKTSETSINSQSKILYFSYHAVSWLLGWFYLYIWLLARSLYTKIAPLTTVHVLPGVYEDEKEEEQTHISRFWGRRDQDDIE